MSSDSDKVDALNHEFHETRQKVARALVEAMRNHPPFKEDIQKVMDELNGAFPELQALKAPMSKLPGTITAPWYEMLPIYDLLEAVERNLKKKSLTPERAREVFAYVMWLSFDLLFKNDLLQPSMREEGSEEREQTKREIRAEQIQFSIKAANALLKKVTNSKSILALREDVPSLFTNLPTRCKGSKDFAARIQSLGSIFEVDLKELRSIVTKASPQWGSIRLIERWLEEKGVTSYEQIVAVWKNIRQLRKAPPTHAEMSREAIEAVAFFGQQFPLDLSLLWDSVLDDFLESLTRFQAVLSSPKMNSG